MIPKALRDIPQWVVWRHERGTKVPYRIDGRRADKTDASCWVDFETACDAAEKFDGIGFCFTGEDGLAGVDLDNCLEADGRPKKWAAEILRLLPTYTEVSPSGRGVKAFLRGIKPDGVKTRVDIEDGRLEVYDRKSYFTVTGQRLPGSKAGVEDCQVGLDEIVDRWLQRTQTTTLPSLKDWSVSQSVKQQSAVEAMLAIKQPDGKDGSRRLLAYCCRGVEWDLTDADIIRCIREVEVSAPFPAGFSDSDILRRIRSAEDKARRGEALEIFVVSQNLGILKPAEKRVLADYDELISTSPGLMRDTANWVLDTSRYRHPALALGASIALWGTVLGRRVRDYSDTRTNVYVLCLAESSSGKDAPLNAPYRLYEQIAEARCLIGVRDFASRMTFQRHLEKQPCCLFAFDEADGLFSSIRNKRNTHMARLSDDFKALWSASNCTLWKGIGFSDTERDIQINQPHACLLCAAVPRRFYSSLGSEDIEGGLVGRFLLFSPQEHFPPRNTRQTVAPPPPRVVAAVRNWLAPSWGGNLSDINPAAAIIDADPAAQRLLDTYEDTVREQLRKLSIDGSPRAAALGKSAEQAAKLSLIAACCCTTESPIITEDCARWGIAVADDCATRLADAVESHVADNRHEALVKDILAYGRQRGKVSQSALTRRFRGVKSRDLSEALTQLSQGNECCVEVEDAGGRPKRVYVFDDQA